MESVRIAPSEGTIHIRKIRGCPRIMGFGRMSDDLAQNLIHNALLGYKYIILLYIQAVEHVLDNVQVAPPAGRSQWMGRRQVG